jgi:hypothetical protein
MAMKISRPFACVAAVLPRGAARGAFLTTFLAAVAIASGQALTPGDLVVSTYGNTGTTIANTAIAGGVYNDGNPTPISLEEFTTSGSFVLTDTLPVTGTGSEVGIVGEYGSSSEGNIQLTGNDAYLTIGGYDAAPSFAGTGGPVGGYSNANGTALAQSTDTAIPRVVAEVGANGTANITTVLNDLYNTNNPRGVYSPDGTTLYISGQGDKSTADQGTFLTTLGTNTVNNPASAPTPIYTANDTRFVTAEGGNLYLSMDKSNIAGIFMYSGMPGSIAAVPTQIIPGSNGLTGSNLVNYSPEGFYFANATTMYIADTGVPKAGGTGDGGIQKWILTGSTWTLAYTLTSSTFVSPILASGATSGETGFEAVTGQTLTGGQVQLFAVSYTAGDDNPDGLYEITDTLSATSESGETFDELAASASDDVFKGVSFTPSASAIPEPSTYAVLGGLLMLGLALVCRRRTRPALT